MIFGTPPEAINMAPLIAALKLGHQYFEVKIFVAGQHRQMLDQVLNYFDIKPDYDMVLINLLRI